MLEKISARREATRNQWLTIGDDDVQDCHVDLMTIMVPGGATADMGGYPVPDPFGLATAGAGAL